MLCRTLNNKLLCSGFFHALLNNFLYSKFSQNLEFHADSQTVESLGDTEGALFYMKELQRDGVEDLSLFAPHPRISRRIENLKQIQKMFDQQGENS